jgi:CubicO group peptidase (beta-lactamase class C family)
MRFLLVLFASVFASVTACSLQRATDTQPSPDQAAFDGWLGDVQRMLAASSAPGASLAVVLDGHLTFAAGVGKKLYNDDAAVTTATRFRVGSLSKMLVAIAAEQLASAGTLDLDAPITTYLPWFALAPGFDATSITTAQLLSHTSGLPCDTIPLCPANADTRTQWFAANPQALWTAPGMTWDYSNPGYSLAALVVSAAAGQPESEFRQLMTDHVFAPANMTTATYDVTLTEQGDYWSTEMSGRLVTVSGILEQTDEFAAQPSADGEVLQGATGAVFVLRGCMYEREPVELQQAPS